MLKQLKKKHEGFTIIEVLIVLAIAGLIMVIVFMAVPALQRNAHNEQYKTEANNFMAAYQEISNNAGGGALGASTGKINNGGTGDAQSVYNAANPKAVQTLTIAAGTSGQSAAPSLTGTGNPTDIILTGVKCSAQNSLTAGPGSARDYAIFYLLEAPGNNTTPQCVDA